MESVILYLMQGKFGIQGDWFIFESHYENYFFRNRSKRWITDDQYDKYFQTFSDQISDIDTRLAILQESEDNYYMMAKYLLQLAKYAYELFTRSEVEERRQLIKLTLSNLRVEGKEVRYEAIKPFDTILNYADRQAWLPQANNIRTVNYLKSFLFT